MSINWYIKGTKQQENIKNKRQLDDCTNTAYSAVMLLSIMSTHVMTTIHIRNIRQAISNNMIKMWLFTI